MSGVHFTTISPSSTSSRRNTPWVEGCCGPIEIVICVSSGRSTISNWDGMFMVALIMKSSTDTQKNEISHEKAQEAQEKMSLCSGGFSRFRFCAFCAFLWPVLLRVSVPWWQIIPDCKARTLATENPCAERDPASHPAKGCGANLDERQRSHQKDRRSRARASSRCAKLRLPSVRAHRLRSAGP